MVPGIEQKLLLLIAVAYVAGSIPFGLIVGLARGVDVRKQGSGNIGASNVGRLLGKKFFFLVMFLDLLKGLLPMLAGSWVVAGQALDQTRYILWLSVGFAAVIGHMFSVFLKFRGGKGVATSAGILLGLWPYYTLPGIITIAVFIILFFATRYISVGSIAAAVTFPIAYLIIGWRSGWHPLGTQWPLLAFAIAISGLVIWKHRSNIARLGGNRASDGAFVNCPKPCLEVTLIRMEAVIRLVGDFELDGTGAAAAWNHAVWLPIIPIKGPSKAMTRAKVVYSATGIYCHYECDDHLLMCSDLKDNDDLWNEDVVEAFFWPSEAQHLYLEYELSPLGVELPLIVPNHDGTFMGWVPWHYSGPRRIRRATSVRGGPATPGATIAGWSAEFFVPFALMQGMGNVPPKPGTRWRANFYRIDYDKNLQTLFAWAIGVNNTFHDFKQFGTIVFA